jgi:hypothetical protein
MSRHAQHQEERPSGYLTGTEISEEEWESCNLAVDQRGELYCYLGYRPDKYHRRDLAYYAVRAGASNPDGRDSFRFVRLSRGSLSYDSFFPERSYYKVLDDRRVVFPGVADFYFGVMNCDSGMEDQELTRARFGGTVQEIELAVRCLGSAIGQNSSRDQNNPRLAASMQRDNRCEVTGCVIPQNFPYVCPSESQGLWGHISLSGFFRTLALIAGNTGAVRNALLNVGLSYESLDRLIGCGTNQHMLLIDDLDV